LHPENVEIQMATVAGNQGHTPCPHGAEAIASGPAHRETRAQEILNIFHTIGVFGGQMHVSQKMWE
jgi:hypothetical protein